MGEEGEREVGNIAAGRKQSLIVPREHGAWGILLVPLVTGAGWGFLRGGSGISLAPLCIVVLALFWLRTPVESWLGGAPVRARTPEEFEIVRRVVLLFSVISVAGLAWLFWGGRNLSLIWIGFAAAAAFLIQFAIRRVWRGARTPAQMVGAAGLTSTAAAAYYVVTGRLDAAAWSLWGANLLFAVNQIQFVQLRIGAARAANRREKLAAGGGFLAGQVALMAAVAAGCAKQWFPWAAAAAFVPVLARGFGWFVTGPKPLAIHKLGKTELAYACLFCVLVLAGTALDLV